MAALFRAMLLVVCLSCAADAQSVTLALYSNQPNALSPAALQATQTELARVLRPVEVELLWKDIAQRKQGEQFDRIAVVSFHGSCSENNLPPIADGGRTILAESAVSDGRVLPFLHVDCSELLQMMGPSLRSLKESQRSVALGRAVARIMAHEIYHIVGQTKRHQESGVAKAAFSIHDLMCDRFDFDVWGLAQMRSLTAAYLQSGNFPKAAAR